MRSHLLFILAICIFACSSPEESELTKLENAVEENPTNANVSQLLTSYSNWLADNTEATDERKTMLLHVLEVSEKHIRLSTKLSAIQALVLDYPSDEETPARLVEMSRLFDAMGKDKAAVILKMAIVKRWPAIPEAEALRTSIPLDTPPLDTAIARLADGMFIDSLFRLNESVARQYVDACEAYALVFHDNPNAAEYLHKAAETARTLRTIPKALALYDWIIRKFPEHDRASQALFLKAFTYDNNLKDSANAGKYYLEFLERYPDDDFTTSAQFLLDNLGKDDDELLKVLQQKAQER